MQDLRAREILATALCCHLPSHVTGLVLLLFKLGCTLAEGAVLRASAGFRSQQEHGAGELVSVPLVQS